MPAVSTINKDEVFKAADTVAATGDRVTYKGVRDALGGGSYETLAPFIKEWKELQKKKAAPPVVQMPEGITAAVTMFGSQVWQAADRMIREQVDAVRKAAEVALKETEGDLAEAQQVISQLEREAAARSTELEKVQQQAALFEGQARTAQVEAREVRSQLAAAAEKITALEAEARELVAAAGEARARRDEDARRITEITRRFEDAAAAASRAEDELVREKEELKVAQSEAARHELARTQAAKTAEELGSEIDKLAAETKVLTERASRAEASETALKDRVKAEAERNEALAAQLQEITSRLGKPSSPGGGGPPKS